MIGTDARPQSQRPRAGEFITRRLNGGLNYSTTWGLTASELRDGWDFDLFESGAIGSRRPLIPFTTQDLGQPVLNSWVWQDILLHDHIFCVLASGEILVATDGATTWTSSVFGVMVDSNSRCTPHAWSAGGWLYVSDGYKVWRWGGTGFLIYNDVTSVLTHPNGDDDVINLGVPPNCAATTYRNAVFIGNTLVYNTDPDAVWWSAAVSEQPDGEPLVGQLTGQEDFYENQRITFIAGPQGDAITSLVSAGPALYAFKRHSVHILSTSGATVLTQDLSSNLGLAGPNAICVHNNDVWFFDEHEGLHVISGSGVPQKVFDPIYSLLDCGRIRHPELVAVGFDGTKVFVSVCLDAGERNNTTFVLNTALSSTSRGGAWSRWNVGFSSFVRWQPQATDSSLVGFTVGEEDDDDAIFGAVRLNECESGLVDDWGFTTRVFAPWFVTAFFDDGLPTLTKRWKGIAVTITGEGDVALNFAARSGARAREQIGCDLPVDVIPELPTFGGGFIRVDLAPRIEGEAICDVGIDEVPELNGVSYPSDVVGEGPVSARLARIASPGTGVAFSLEVRDVGSESGWTIEELDCKYDAILNYF